MDFYNYSIEQVYQMSKNGHGTSRLNIIEVLNISYCVTCLLLFYQYLCVCAFPYEMMYSVHVAVYLIFLSELRRGVGRQC